MDVGYYGHYEEECDNDDPEEEVGAATEDMRCYRCQGYGYRASGCATPAKGKGKGFKSKAMGKEKDFTAITKVKERGPRVMARVGASKCSAPTAGNVDMARPIAGRCTLTRCRGRRLRIVRRKMWPSAEMVSTWVLWTW